ncbi:MAG TPA: chemotaxis protein CheB, partial [Bacteroidales bacterium]|nr:chemotaxis protein CheB [Bacteroidales bacterium]
EVHDKESIKKGVYLSPANYHVMIEPNRTFALSTEEDVNYSRPSIDITFESAGHTYKKSMAGILLSGTNSDGSRGLFSAFKSGAYTIIQDPANAQFGIMPGEALTFFKPHLKLKDLEIIEFVNSLVRVNK